MPVNWSDCWTNWFFDMFWYPPIIFTLKIANWDQSSSRTHSKFVLWQRINNILADTCLWFLCTCSTAVIKYTTTLVILLFYRSSRSVWIYKAIIWNSSRLLPNFLLPYLKHKCDFFLKLSCTLQENMHICSWQRTRDHK